MRFDLTIECDNAAFSDAMNHEIARIIRKLADDLEDEMSVDEPVILRDINGNRVGTARLS